MGDPDRDLDWRMFDTQLGLQVGYPETWRAVPEVHRTLFYPEGFEAVSDQLFIPVIKIKVLSHGAPLPDSVPHSYVLKEVQKRRGCYDVRLSDQVLARRRAKKVMYKTESPIGVLQHFQSWVFYASNEYIIHFRCPEETFLTYSQEVNQILSAMAFVSPSPSIPYSLSLSLSSSPSLSLSSSPTSLSTLSALSWPSSASDSSYWDLISQDDEHRLGGLPGNNSEKRIHENSFGSLPGMRSVKSKTPSLTENYSHVIYTKNSNGRRHSLQKKFRKSGEEEEGNKRTCSSEGKREDEMDQEQRRVEKRREKERREEERREEERQERREEERQERREEKREKRITEERIGEKREHDRREDINKENKAQYRENNISARLNTKLRLKRRQKIEAMKEKEKEEEKWGMLFKLDDFLEEHKAKDKE
eukprot:TRINITY_DN5113_c0_g1_i1.p1 TRINITY_DN5113_c0_g1~~TRINITY_DN5113_c0_g1_i1.p1  ORF type:complete len:419 (-),score=109.46 TRINITY_DN5113_c0_g1_i1:224-1480(-)